MRKIMYIDCQSMSNLAIYDYGVLSEFTGSIIYVCSKYYDYKSLANNIKQVKLFKYNKISNKLLKAISYLCSLFQLLLLIIKEKPNVIHVQWYRVPLLDYYFYSFIKKTTKAHFVFTAHNLLPHDSGHKYYNIFRNSYIMFDRIIVHSDRTQKELCENFGITESKIKVVPHGILDIPVNENTIQNNLHEFYKQYDIKDKTVFLSLGFQTIYKGTDLLAKAWSEEKKLHSNNNIRLIIAGIQKSIDISYLYQYSNVIVRNKRLSNEEFVFLLRHANVYLLPYRKISQSGALLTALKERVPVLVSKVGGLTDPFKIANIGWIIEPNDIDSLKNQLIYLSENKEEIIKIQKSKSKWDRISNYYSWKRISKRTFDIYSNL